MFDDRFPTLKQSAMSHKPVTPSSMHQQHQFHANDKQWAAQSPSNLTFNTSSQPELETINTLSHRGFEHFSDPANNSANHAQSCQSSNHETHSQQVRQMLLDSAWNNMNNQNNSSQQLPQASGVNSRTSSANEYSTIRSPAYTSGSNTPSDQSLLASFMPPDHNSARLNESSSHNDFHFMPDQASTYNDEQQASDQIRQMSLAQSQVINQYQSLQQLFAINSSVPFDVFPADILGQQLCNPPPGWEAQHWQHVIVQSPVALELIKCLMPENRYTFETYLETWADGFIRRARDEVVLHAGTGKPVDAAIHAVEVVKLALAIQQSRKQNQAFQLRRCFSENGPARFGYSPAASPNRMFTFDPSVFGTDTSSMPARARNLGTQAPHPTPAIPAVPLLPEQPTLANTTFHNRQISAPPPSLNRSPGLAGTMSMMQLNREIHNARSDAQYLGMHAAARGASLSPSSLDGGKRRRRRSEELSEAERWNCPHDGCWRFYRKSSTASIRAHLQTCQHRDVSKDQEAAKASEAAAALSLQASQPAPSPPRPTLETLREDPELVIFRDE